ncbi:hypothetical protein [Lewinella sp. LCG006]|uniref:hypothetical protein n=1 Tax=Lewinella sp. LCG006 TaxID=3231911 RepID=UPI00345FE33D
MKNTISFYLALLSCMNCQYVVAQISVFGNAEGESSIQVIDHNALVLNAKEASFGFAYAPTEYNEDAKLNWAINLKTKAKGGISNLFSSNELKLDIKLAFPLSIPMTKGRSYAYLIPSVDFSRPSIYNAAAEIGEQVVANNELGTSLAIGYNDEDFHNFILGISCRGGLMDNSTLIEILSIQTIQHSTTGANTTVYAVTERSAYDMLAYSSGNNFFRANFDVGNNLFTDRLIWLLQGGVNFDENLKPIHNLGFGIYLTKDESPLEVAGGIQIQLSDLTKNRTDAVFSERLMLNFVTSISLN